MGNPSSKPAAKILLLLGSLIIQNALSPSAVAQTNLQTTQDFLGSTIVVQREPFDTNGGSCGVSENPACEGRCESLYRTQRAACPSQRLTGDCFATLENNRAQCRMACEGASGCIREEYHEVLSSGIAREPDVAGL